MELTCAALISAQEWRIVQQSPWKPIAFFRESSKIMWIHCRYAVDNMAQALLGTSGVDTGTSLRTIKTPRGGAAMTSATTTFSDFEAQTIEARVYLQRV